LRTGVVTTKQISRSPFINNKQTKSQISLYIYDIIDILRNKKNKDIIAVRLKLALRPSKNAEYNDPG